MKSVVDRIKTLVELRDKGSISKEEFDQMLALLEQELHRENKDVPTQNTNGAPQNIEPSGKPKTILLISAAGVLVLVVLSFFTMVPAFLWDSDGDGFHNYRNDNCPAESGTCQGCLDSDNDGFVDSEDECPKESSTTCKGCPDKDSDGISDSLDHCPDVHGVKYKHGCPDTDGPDATPTMDDTQKLLNGEAVKVPAELGNYVVTNKWLRLKNNCYEYSDYEKKEYKKVAKNETVEKLNDYYGLQVPLPQQDPKPKPQGVKGPKTEKLKMPKPQKTIIDDPEPKMPKHPKGKGLTDSEEAELNGLILRSDNNELLSPQEKARMTDLKLKRKL